MSSQHPSRSFGFSAPAQTFPEVSKGRLGEFRIPLPSLRRQRRLAAALSRRTDAGQEALEAARAQLRSGRVAAGGPSCGAPSILEARVA